MNLLRTISASLALVAFAFLAKAQETKSPAEMINEIKMTNDYIFAECTSVQWDDAYNNAVTLLERCVEDWTVANKSALKVPDIMKGMKHIKATRGDFFRAFVYVQKPGQRIDITPAPPKDTVEKTVPVNEPKQMEPKPKPANNPATAGSTVKTGTDKAMTEEDLMLDVKKFEDIKDYIEGLKGRDKLRDYGKYATLPEGSSYLFVYAKDGLIKAIIRKDAKGQTNLMTGKADEVTTYKGCGAVWFRMK